MSDIRVKNTAYSTGMQTGNATALPKPKPGQLTGHTVREVGEGEDMAIHDIQYNM